MQAFNRKLEHPAVKYQDEVGTDTESHARGFESKEGFDTVIDWTPGLVWINGRSFDSESARKVAGAILSAAIEARDSEDRAKR